MAYIGEMQYLTIGNNTYSLPTGSGGGGSVTSVGLNNATNGGLTISGTNPVTSSGTITVGHTNILTSAQSTSAVYPITIDKNGHIASYGSAVTIPTITLNGSSTTSASFYAPTSAGTDGYVLKSNGSGAPTWVSATLTDTKLQVEDLTTNYNSSVTHRVVLRGNGTAASTGYISNIYFSHVGGSTSSQGYANLILGNEIITGTNGNSTGRLVLYASNNKSTQIDTNTLTDNNIITLPSGNGTLALTSDIPTVPTNISAFTNDSGYITSYTDEKLKWTASTSSNSYYPLVSTSTATTSTANTLNGIDFYQYYNTAGGYRRLDLGNSTAYKSTGGAYGTIRLYGAAATYYGDLVPGVLGTTTNDGHISANRTWTLPDKTGTVALTSDIPTVPTNVSAFTNDAGYITDSDIPEGASAYTGTISAVSTSAATGSSNAFARGDHVHNITSSTITSALGFTPVSTDTNTTYSLSGALSSHKFTNTLTAGGSGSGTSTSDFTLAAGTGISLTDNTSTRTITIATNLTVPTITLNGSGTTSPSFYAPTGTGTSGQYLKSNGSGAPSWTSFPTIPSITLNGSSSTSPSFYAPTSAGTSGYYLKSNGSGAPSWTSFPTIPSITLNGSSSTSPSFYAPTTAGTSGYYLKSNGSGAPTWAAISTTSAQIIRW